MPYRFVHAADIHLDSPLKSLALRDPELAELIGNATRRAFASIIELCLAEQVDALLLAGDLYDGNQTSMKTARFIAEQIRQLHEAGIAVFIIRGNHDALSKITKELTFPESVKLFSGRAEAIAARCEQFPVTIHGLSFAQPHAPESLLPRYRPPTEGAVNIGLMHTSLAGAPGHDPYAPCSVFELAAAGFDYWALGHIHKRSIVEGRCNVIMPGMPQGRDIGESGAKSVTLVTIDDSRLFHCSECFTSVAQFELVTIDLTGIETWPDMVTVLTRNLEQQRAVVSSDHLVARLRFTGTTPLSWRLRRDTDLLKAEATDRAFVIGKSWIDKIEIDCHAPGAAITGQAADPITELRRLIDQDILHSDAYHAEATAAVNQLRTQLPPDLRDLFGADEAAFKTMLTGLMKEGAEDVLARLRSDTEII